VENPYGQVNAVLARILGLNQLSSDIRN
jgi:hypothetical protein